MATFSKALAVEAAARSASGSTARRTQRIIGKLLDRGRKAPRAAAGQLFERRLGMTLLRPRDDAFDEVALPVAVGGRCPDGRGIRGLLADRERRRRSRRAASV